MGDWQQILFERRLLTWASLLSAAGLALWLAALCSPHWLVAVPRGLYHENSTLLLPSPLLSPPAQGRGLIWAHSGLYSLSSLVEGEAGLVWEHEAWVVPRVPALHSELVMAGASLLLGLAALGLSVYSVRRPYPMVRRLAATMHLLGAGSAITVLQLVNSAGHTDTLHPPSQEHSLHYGYSVLLALGAIIISFFVSLSFCCSSKKRKLLRNENVTFMNKKLVISEDLKGIS